MPNKKKSAPFGGDFFHPTREEEETGEKFSFAAHYEKYGGAPEVNADVLPANVGPEKAAIRQEKTETLITNSEIIGLDDDVRREEVDDVDVTDPTQFPIWKGKTPPNKTIDSGRYNEFEMAEEHGKFTVETLNQDDVYHIRTARQADRRCEEILKAAKSVKDGTLFVGFDTEGTDATVQLSFRTYGLEKTYVFQLVSGEFGAGQCINDRPDLPDIIPSKLAEVFCLPCVVFVGHAPREEIVTIARKLQIAEEKIRNIKLIDICKTYSLISAMAAGSDETEQWAQTLSYGGRLGGRPSLLFLHQFAKNGYTLNKMHYLRNHLADLSFQFE